MILLEGWLHQAMSSSLLVAAPLALLAGVASFASPCVLPLLPGYLSYASGVGAHDVVAGRGKRSSLVWGTVGFIAGFAVVFMLTGALFGALGSFLLQHIRLITVLSGVVIVVMAAAFMGWVPIPETARPQFASRFSILAAPLLGVAFGLGWTPCIGPTLSIVLTMAVTEGSATAGAFLALVYALGLGLPFLVFALAFRRLSRHLEWMKEHQRGIQMAAAGVMALVGVAMIVGWWESLVAALRQWAASFGTVI